MFEKDLRSHKSFIQRTDIGSEYFEGDLGGIISVFSTACMPFIVIDLQIYNGDITANMFKKVKSISITD